MIMRPFGWDTLAVRIYSMTAEGQWERAALPAVTLIAIGLVPVYLLIRNARGSGNKAEARTISILQDDLLLLMMQSCHMRA